MPFKFIGTGLMLIMLMLSACSEAERMIIGKWNLAGTMIGGAPSSFWFKWNGAVTAPWESHNYALLSEGTYDFSNDRRISIRITQGHYKGNRYDFEIIKIDKNELILGSDYEEIRLKRVKEQ